MESTLYAFAWYLLITLIGLLTFPLAYSLLPVLPDRGYTFSRIIGLLLWGYLFWLLASLGILNNNVGGLLFALGILIILSFLAIRKSNVNVVIDWLKANKRTVIAIEILFLTAFIFMVIVRAANPEIEGTEKPMELAFINSILNSDTFPPHDPWLSGYAISYYYFGYVLVAMLAKLTGVPGNYAFNLGIATIFALSSLGAYGLLYNIIKLRYREKSAFARIYALLGPFFVLIVSNLEGFLHSLHSRGLFWRLDETGQYSSTFWQWLDIKDLNLPPTEPLSFIPSKFWWWWRASRVIQDYNFIGEPLEIINEFPFFSFLLGDLHPHVLAIPFTFLVAVIALNIFLVSASKFEKAYPIRLNPLITAWSVIIGFALSLGLLFYGLFVLNIPSITVGIIGIIFAFGGIWYLKPVFDANGLKTFIESNIESQETTIRLYMNIETFIFTGVIVGGMAFLNTWDILIAIVLVGSGYALGRLYGINNRKFSNLVKNFILICLGLGFLAIVLYLPFFIGFSSQAGGILPNLIFPTRGSHLWVMFVPLLIPIFGYLIFLLSKKSQSKELSKAAIVSLSIILGLWILSLLLGLLIVNLPEIRDIEVGRFFLSFLGAPDSSSLFKETIVRRIIYPGGWITLLLLLTFTIGLLFKAYRQDHDNTDFRIDRSTLEKADIFVLILVFIGILLTLGIEFFYLRDQFGWRINTIFKFYYQTWLLWGIAAAYGIIVLIKSYRSIFSKIILVISTFVIITSLFYPVLSLLNKTNSFQSINDWTLNGTDFLYDQAAAEIEATEWLHSAPKGIVAEAVSPTGGSYTYYARVATLSGQPSVLGWMGHESQWRGGNQEMGSRQPDMELLYCSRSSEETLEIIERYNIRYIYLGPLERTTYRANQGSCPVGIYDIKFDSLFTLAFENTDVRIYEVSGIEK